MKLFKPAVAFLMILCMLACMSVSGSAVDAGSFSVCYAKSEDSKTLTVTVYAHNYIGLIQGTIDATYSGGVKFDHGSVGREARKVNDCADNCFVADFNSTSPGKVIYGFYFKEMMWDSDTFAAHADEGDRLFINVANFDLVSFVFKLDGSAYEINIGIRSKSYDGDNSFFSDKITGGNTAKPGTDDSPGYSQKLGDVNGDGKVGSDDARLALRASVNLERYDRSSVQFYAADVNKDGKIGPDDARSILRVSVRLEKWVFVGDIDAYGKTILGFDPLTGKAIVGYDRNGYAIYSEDPLACKETKLYG